MDPTTPWLASMSSRTRQVGIACSFHPFRKLSPWIQFLLTRLRDFSRLGMGRYGAGLYDGSSRREDGFNATPLDWVTYHIFGIYQKYVVVVIEG